MEVGSTPQSTPVTPQMPVLSAAAGPAYHQQPLASVSAAPSPTSVATSPPAAPASAALAVQSLQGARAHQPSDPTVFQLTDRQVLHHVAARPHCRGHVVQEILRSLQCRPRHQVVCGRCGAVQLQMRSAVRHVSPMGAEQHGCRLRTPARPTGASKMVCLSVTGCLRMPQFACVAVHHQRAGKCQHVATQPYGALRSSHTLLCSRRTMRQGYRLPCPPAERL